MVIADMISSDELGGEPIGRAYLAAAPFPGDVIHTTGGDFLVIRRTFLDLGPEPDGGSPDKRLSLELKVRPL